MNIQIILGCIMIGFTIYRSISYHIQQRYRASTSPETLSTQDVVSSRLIEIIYTLIYGVATYTIFFGTIPIWLMSAGLCCMAVAWIIRQIALKDLGRNYGHEIKLFTEHQLVQHGIYKYMRHPLYLGLCIDTFGATLISFTFLGTFLFVAFLLVIVRRVHLEDTALISRFGEDARKYHERVPSIRIWPSL